MPICPSSFSRALGNVLRHNSFVRSREDGVALQLGAVDGDAGGSQHLGGVAGTIAEFNVVRDAHIGYHAGPQRPLGVSARPRLLGL